MGVPYPEIHNNPSRSNRGTPHSQLDRQTTKQPDDLTKSRVVGEWVKTPTANPVPQIETPPAQHPAFRFTAGRDEGRVGGCRRGGECVNVTSSSKELGLNATQDVLSDVLRARANRLTRVRQSGVSPGRSGGWRPGPRAVGSVAVCPVLRQSRSWIPAEIAGGGAGG